MRNAGTPREKWMRRWLSRERRNCTVKKLSRGQCPSEDDEARSTKIRGPSWKLGCGSKRIVTRQEQAVRARRGREREEKVERTMK